MDQWKGIGHLIDFMLDGGKASLGTIGIAIVDHALLGRFCANPSRMSASRL